MPNLKPLLPMILLPALLPAKLFAQRTDWTKSSLAPMELAARVDNRLHSLKTTSLDYQYQFKMDTGLGTFLGRCAVKSPTQYRIEYPIVGVVEKKAFTEGAIIQNGNQIVQFTRPWEGGKPAKKTFSGSLPSSLPPNVAEAWYRGNVKMLLSAIGTHENPLESLVKSASANPEFTVKAETRERPVRDRQIRDYRILVTRKPAYAKTKGGLIYEIVIGDVYYFPLSMSNYRILGKTQFGSAMFGNRWNASSNQKWQKDDFNPRITKVLPK